MFARGSALLLLTAAALATSACLDRPASDGPRARGDIHLPKSGEVIEAEVPRNATLASVLRAHELGDAVISGIVDAAHSAFDLRRLRASQPYRLEVSAAGAVREFVYRIDADRFLRVSPAPAPPAAPVAEPGFTAEVVDYPKEVAVAAVRGTIDREHPSLVAAMDAAGEGITLAIALAEVFGGEIDFNSDLQPGDEFELVFEKRLSDGRFAGYGEILGGEFRNDGRVLRAFRFEQPGQPAGYYDEQGRSLKRFFLRSPLRFEPRISSGFSMRRLHPVLGTWRAHPAIDYVAPTGTPVIAVASGVVTRAGWMSGGGKTVTIKHARGYETNYLHLSAINVRAGERVAQGAVIGKVGCTGLCTGPHLDYRVKRDGQWVNPLLEHKRLPPGEPIAEAHLAAFTASRDAALARFVSRVPEPLVAAND
jgi:murein DD-endopeptidase MepM/ murein hydrolase activator NlpD